MNETSAPDNSLLRWQERDLNEAEARILETFREGWKADAGLLIRPGGGNTPEKPAEGRTANDWQGAILRAGFVRDLFLGNYGEFDPRLIVISHAWIEGPLVLDYCGSRLPIVFSQCIFSDGISLRNAVISELVLRECEVRCFLYAQGSKVRSNVYLVDGFRAGGEVNLAGASLGGSLFCNGIFGKGLNADHLGTKFGVRLNNGFKSNGKVNLSDAKIGGGLICSGLFIGDLDVSGAEIRKEISLNGTFKKSLIAQNLKAGSDVIMGVDAQAIDFDSNGEVNLLKAEISGALALNGSFEKGLNAQNLKTGSDVFLRSEFKSNGVVNLGDAEIGRSLILKGEMIAIFLDNADVRGALRDLQKWPHRGSINGFRYHAIESVGDTHNWKMDLDWVEAMTKSTKFSPQPYEQLMSVYRRMGHTNWARNIGFELEKKRSKEFKGWQWLTWRPWYGILRWTIGYGYKPFRFVPWALGLVTAGFFLFSSGYNGIVSKYAPPSWPPLAPPLACLDNKWIPSEAEALESQTWKQDRKPPPDYLPFNPLIYSLEATFPVLPLGQLEKWHPSNPCLLIVRWALTLIGTPLLAILALFGAGVLGPRWRSGDEGG